VDHFEASSERGPRAAAEARDYCRRLAQAIALEPGLRVLDFGCGTGHVGAILAPRVSAYLYWDPARAMRREASTRLAGLSHAQLVDLGAPADPRGAIDLILVNSVVQYMAEGELRSWLPRWREMLAPGGQVVLSDLVPPGAGALGDLLETLAFARGAGYLLGAARADLPELLRYARQRRSMPLLPVDVSTLGAWAGAAGLSWRPLRANLTFRARRQTIVLLRPG
jgi:SAM-dependent methyltransferase